MWERLERTLGLVWDLLSLIGWALLLAVAVRAKDMDDEEEYFLHFSSVHDLFIELLYENRIVWKTTIRKHLFANSHSHRLTLLISVSILFLHSSIPGSLKPVIPRPAWLIILTLH